MTPETFEHRVSFVVEVDTRVRADKLEQEKGHTLALIMRTGLKTFCEEEYKNNRVRVDYFVTRHEQLHTWFATCVVEIDCGAPRNITMNKTKLRKALDNASLKNSFPNYILKKNNAE